MRLNPRITLLSLSLLAAALPASASAAPRCDGRSADVQGTSGSDRIVARAGQVIATGDGRDRVEISDRRVVVCTGAGRDRITFADTPGGDAIVESGPGNDFIGPYTGDLDYAQVYLRIRADGGRGDDLLVGAYADDRLAGGAGNDEILGNHDADRIDGGSGRDRLFGNSPSNLWVDGRNRISGGSGADRIFGGLKDDRLFGDDGDDRLKGNDGDDLADGGADFDRCEAERKVACED